jgi:hypothetical protein
MYTRKTIVGIIVVCVAMGFAPPQISLSQTPERPVAAIVVTTDTGLDKLLMDIRDFANEQNASVTNFPQTGQQAVNVGISLTGNTTIFVNNGISRRRYMFSIYSQESPDVWRPKWNNLLDRLAGTFGPQNITPINR